MSKFEIKCRLEKKLPPLTKEKFSRQDVIAQTIEENPNYKPQTLRFEFCKNDKYDNLSKLKKFEIGDEVIIKFNIKGNEAKNTDGSASGRVFNNLVAYDIVSAADNYEGSGE